MSSDIEAVGDCWFDGTKRDCTPFVLSDDTPCHPVASAIASCLTQSYQIVKPPYPRTCGKHSKWIHLVVAMAKKLYANMCSSYGAMCSRDPPSLTRPQHLRDVDQEGFVEMWALMTQDCAAPEPPSHVILVLGLLSGMFPEGHAKKNAWVTDVVRKFSPALSSADLTRGVFSAPPSTWDDDKDAGPETAAQSYLEQFWKENEGKMAEQLRNIQQAALAENAALMGVVDLRTSKFWLPVAAKLIHARGLHLADKDTESANNFPTAADMMPGKVMAELRARNVTISILGAGAFAAGSVRELLVACILPFVCKAEKQERRRERQRAVIDRCESIQKVADWCWDVAQYPLHFRMTPQEKARLQTQKKEGDKKKNKKRRRTQFGG